MHESVLMNDLMTVLAGPADAIEIGETRTIDSWPFPVTKKIHDVAWRLQLATKRLNEQFASRGKTFNIAPAMERSGKRSLILTCFANEMADAPVRS